MRALLLAAALLVPSAAAALPTTLGDGTWELRFAAGVEDVEPLGSELRLLFDLSAGLTDRLQLTLLQPGLAGRIGSPDTELVLWGGFRDWAIGTEDGDFAFAARPGVFAELRLGDGLIGGGFETAYSRNPFGDGFAPWVGSLYGGWLLRAGPLEFNPGLSVGGRLHKAGEFGYYRAPGTWIGLGSVMQLGGRRVPLVRIVASRRFSIDGYASAAFDTDLDLGAAEALLGFGWSH